MSRTEVVPVPEKKEEQKPPQFQAPAAVVPPPQPQGVPVKIFTAIPTTQYVHINWATVFHQVMSTMPPGSSFTPISQYGVAESRERLVDIFLSMPDMTHVLFWDTDIIPPISVDGGKPVWLSMLEDGAPIVAGVYANSLRTGLNGWLKTGQTPDGIDIHQPINLALRPQIQNLMQVDLLGFGFVMISRPVFQQLLDKKVPRPWFHYSVNEPNEEGKNEMLSEDFYFVKKKAIKELNIKPVIDMRIKCIHMRMYGTAPDGSIV